MANDPVLNPGETLGDVVQAQSVQQTPQQTAPQLNEGETLGDPIQAAPAPAPENPLFKKHPANLLYRDIRSRETPDQIAARQVTAKAASERIMQPVTTNDLMTPEQQQQHPIVAGISDVATGMLTPTNIAFMAGTAGLGTLAGPEAKLASMVMRALSATFSASQIMDAAKESPEAWDAIKRGDSSTALRLITHIVGNVAFATQAGHHAAGIEPTPSTAWGEKAQQYADAASHTVRQAFQSDVNNLATANAQHKAAQTSYDQRFNEHSNAVQSAGRAISAVGQAKVDLANGKITQQQYDDINSAASQTASNVRKASQALAEAQESYSRAAADVDKFTRKINKSHAELTQKQTQDIAGAKEDFMRAVPSARKGAAAYSDQDYQVGRRYLEDHHENVQPLQTTQDVYDALDSIERDLNNHVQPFIEKYAKEPITTNVRMDVRDRLAESTAGKSRADFVSDAMKSLEEYNLTDPTIEEADTYRQQLNSEVRDNLKKNFRDIQTALDVDPDFAAKYYALESLRDGIYGALEERGVEGAREIRQDQRSIIKLRNAAEDQIKRGDVKVRGSGESGPIRKAVAAGVRRGSTIAGAAVGSVLGPVGAGAGAELGAMGGEYFGKKIAPGDLTRNDRVQRSFKVKGGGVPMTESAPGTATPQTMQPPSAVSPVMQLYTPQRELTPLHSDLATHYGEDMNQSGYIELEKRFKDDIADKRRHNVPLESDEKTLLGKINQADAADRLAAQKQLQEQAAKGQEQIQEGDSAAVRQTGQGPSGPANKATEGTGDAGATEPGIEPEDLITSERRERQTPLREPYSIEIGSETGEPQFVEIDAFSPRDAIKTAQKKYPNANSWSIQSAGARAGEPTAYSVPKEKLLSMPKSQAEHETAPRPPVKTIRHELGHAMIGLKEGMQPRGMYRHIHVEMPSTARAAVGWSMQGMRDPITGYVKIEKLPGVIRQLMGGIAADEAFNDTPRNINRNFNIRTHGSDANTAYRFLKQAGYTHEGALDRLNRIIDENKQYLTHPAVSGVIKENENFREPGLSRQYHYSPDRLQSMHIEAQRRIQNGPGTEPNNGSVGRENLEGHTGNVLGGQAEGAAGTGQALQASELTPRQTIENEGLNYLGEVSPGTGVHMFEHPNEPGKTAALKAPFTGEQVRNKMASKVTEFAPQPQIVAHEQNGGSTFTPRGENLSGKNLYSVGSYPERTQQIDKLTPEALAKFKADNQDLLSQPDHAVGTWKDRDTGKTVLDVSKTYADRDRAIAAGKQANQKAIYHLGSNTEIPTGGTGEARVLDKIKEKYGTTNDPLVPSFISPSGERIAVGQDHDLAVKSVAPETGIKKGVIDEGGVRVRTRTSAAGPEAVFSIPEHGVTDRQIEQMKKTAAAMKRSHLIIETAGPRTGEGFAGSTALKSAERDFGTANDIEPMLREIGAHPEQTKEFAPKLSPKGSTVPLMGKPLTVRGVGEENKINTLDIAKALNQYTNKKIGSLELGEAEPAEQIERAKKLAEDEAKYQLSQANSGKDWYTKDIGEHDQVLREMRPELNDPAKMSLFKMAEAVLSSGQKPYGNFKSAVKAWDHYNETGEFPPVNPDTGRSWGPRGVASYGSAIDSINRLIKEKGEQGASDWLLSEHPLSELRQYMTPSQTPVRGKATDVQPGAMILGAKRGPFAQNLHGIEAPFTADMWVSRTWNRWMGTIDHDPNTGEITTDRPRNETERQLMKESFKQTADKLGLTTSSLQAVLWFYEQKLYEAHGMPKESWTFSDAAKRAQREENEEQASEPKFEDGNNLTPGISALGEPEHAR